MKSKWQSKTHQFNAFTFIKDSGIIVIATLAPWDLWVTVEQAAGIIFVLKMVDGLVYAKLRNITTEGVE